MDAVALGSPVESKGDISNMEGISISDIEGLEGLVRAVDGAEELLEIGERPISQGVGFHVVSLPALGVLSDVRNHLAVHGVRAEGRLGKGY